MAPIVAHPQSVVPESTIVECGSSDPLTSRPSQYDMSSPACHDEYVPLPPGHWTLKFHGNCPRCHHTHRGVDAKVTTTPGDAGVSYIECEKCRDRWAAFGGHDSTRISLVSIVTLESDLVARGTRYSFYDIVMLAYQQGLIGTSSKTTSLGPSTRAHASSNDKSRSPLPFQGPSESPLHTRDVGPVEPSRDREDVELEASPSVSSEDQIVVKNRSGTVKLLSKLTAKIRTRLQKLRRHGNGKHLPGSYGQKRLSARQFEKSPAQFQPSIEARMRSAEPPLMRSDALDVSDGDQFAEAEVEKLDFTGPSKRLAEVVAFIVSLDKSVLWSMNEEERSEWMRKEYMIFKARHKKAPPKLGLSPIVHVSHPPSNRVERIKFGVGSHREGFGLWSSLEAAFRRGSITIGQDVSATSQRDTADELTSRRSHLSKGIRLLRPGPRTSSRYNVRPQSSRRASRLRLRRRVRDPSDPFAVNGLDSTPSARGRVRSRISNSSLSFDDGDGIQDVPVPFPISELPDMNVWSTTSLIPRPAPISTDRETISSLMARPNSSAIDTIVPDLVPSPDATLLESSIPTLITEQSSAHEEPDDTNIQNHGSGSNPGQDKASPSNTLVGHNSTACSSGTSGSKRARKEPPNNNNDNNDTHRRKRKQRLDYDCEESSSKLFACPFPKHDPMKHTGCWEFTFQKDRFGDLRQHFERRHPVYVHCPRCGMSFKGNDMRAKLLEHQVQPQACELVADFQKSTDGITADDWLKIKGRKRAVDDQYWMYIYELLFKGRPHSSHPYAEDYAALAFRLYQESCTRCITRRVAEDIVSFVTQATHTGSDSDLTLSELLTALPKLVEPGVRNGLLAGMKDRTNTTVQPPPSPSTTAQYPTPVVLDSSRDSLYNDDPVAPIIDNCHTATNEPSGCLTSPFLGHIDQQEVDGVDSGILPPVMMPDLTGFHSQNGEIEESFYGNIDAISSLPWLPPFDLAGDPLPFTPNV